MQHELSLHPTSLVKWRHWAGVDRLSELLQETIAVAVRENESLQMLLALCSRLHAQQPTDKGNRNVIPSSRETFSGATH